MIVLQIRIHSKYREVKRSHLNRKTIGLYYLHLLSIVFNLRINLKLLEEDF